MNVIKTVTTHHFLQALICLKLLHNDDYLDWLWSNS